MLDVANCWTAVTNISPNIWTIPWFVSNCKYVDPLKAREATDHLHEQCGESCPPQSNSLLAINLPVIAVTPRWGKYNAYYRACLLSTRGTVLTLSLDSLSRPVGVTNLTLSFSFCVSAQARDLLLVAVSIRSLPSHHRRTILQISTNDSQQGISIQRAQTRPILVF